jgi:hypothetical protein
VVAVPGVAAGPDVRLPPTEFGFVVNPLDVAVPLVPPLDCKLPPIEFGFVVNPLDVDADRFGVTMMVPDGVVVVVAVVLVGGVVGELPIRLVAGGLGVVLMFPEVSAGGVGGTGGTTVIAGANTRGGRMSLLSRQSGPLRSMHTGTASGTLISRLVDSALNAGAAIAQTAIHEKAVRKDFIWRVLRKKSAATGAGRNRARHSALAAEQRIARSYVAQSHGGRRRWAYLSRLGCASRNTRQND